MSAFAAMIRFDGKTVDPADLHAMTEAMAERAHDGIRHWVDGAAGLGYCALHTNAASRLTPQPLASASGNLHIVFDGYFLNRDEVGERLRSKGFATPAASDAMLLLQAYQTWGPNCLAGIEGEFAFVIWDDEEQEAYCGRDHLGMRPIVYYRDAEKLLVASSVSAILAALPRRPDLNSGYLAETMANDWLTREETAWMGIKRPLPAHWMRFSRDGCETRQYWDVNAVKPIRYAREDDYAEHYLELLTRLVRQASLSDRPVSFEASGGLDSSAVLAIAADLQRQGNLQAPAIRAYTLGAPEGTDADERDFVEALSKHVGIEIASPPMFMPGEDWYAQRTAQLRDLAPYPNSAMLGNIGGQLVAGGSRVVLTGQGGDHCLNGSPYYYRQAIANFEMATFLRCMARDAREVGLRKAMQLAFRYGIAPSLPRSLRDAYRRIKPRSSPTHAPREKSWLNAAMQRELALRRNAARSKMDDDFDRYLDQRFKHPFILRVFEMLAAESGRIGYEARHPMFARSFIGFFAATPEHLRQRGKVRKALHRKAMAGLLPEVILKRQTKGEFSIVYEQHETMFERLFTKDIQGNQMGMLDGPGALALYKKYCSAPIDRKSAWELWAVYLVYLLHTFTCRDTSHDQQCK